LQWLSVEIFTGDI